ncbi:MAG: methionine adenosyltransferase [Betaproteobacteria bacterium]|nr:methionine adenosyltransferase [Betaproteobacteria bacterium]
MELVVDADTCPVADALAVEMVERKGLGHPDTVCDAVAEAFAAGLARVYAERFGGVLHHNVDKVLLAGGASAPRFGGGRILEPFSLHLAGRATERVGDETVPVADIGRTAVHDWFSAHLPEVTFHDVVRVRVLTRPGSTDLASLYRRAATRGGVLANDTSVGVGFAPLSRLERIVDAAERTLTDPGLRSSWPWLGADVKVMGVRVGTRITLTVACAFVDRHVTDVDDYLRKKALVADRVRATAHTLASQDIDVVVNAADDPETGDVYLTVTGLSAEAGDDGQAGRGNRVNGLITPMRPMTIESYAGKNAVTHVGKLYNVIAGLVAEDVVRQLPEVAGATCTLVSRIGEPVSSPQACHVRLVLAGGTGVHRLRSPVERVVSDHLARAHELWRDMLTGRIVTDRWPLVRRDISQGDA